MSLPPPGHTEWPPKTLDKAYQAYRTNSAWYGGDPQVLHSLYGANHGGLDLADKRYRNSVQATIRKRDQIQGSKKWPNMCVLKIWPIMSEKS